MRKPNDINIAGADWVILRAYMLEMLSTLREANDNKDLDQVSTAVIRGKIEILKTLISIESSILKNNQNA